MLSGASENSPSGSWPCASATIRYTSFENSTPSITPLTSLVAVTFTRYSPGLVAPIAKPLSGEKVVVVSCAS